MENSNIYNIIYGDSGSIKTIINHFIGNTQLNKIFALVLFIVSLFTSLSEIISYTFTDFAILIFKTENFYFSPNMAVTCCQMFSCFVFAVAVNRKILQKSVVPALFFIITILMKLSIEMQLRSITYIYLCFSILMIFSIVLLIIYDSIEKKSLKQE